MQSSDSYKVEDGLSVLLIGDPKSGKTGVAMAFPDPYILDVDGNLASAVRVLDNKKFWYDQPAKGISKKTNKPVEEWEVWERALEMLKEPVVSPEVKTIIVDSFSLLSSYARGALLKNLQNIGAVDQKGKPLENLRQNDYLTLLDWFRRFVFTLRKSGKYIVVTSHQQVIQDDSTGAVRYALAVPGQSKDSFGGCFSDAWLCSASTGSGGKVNYKIRTRPTGFNGAIGTSIRSLPAEFDVTDKRPADIWAMLAPQIGYLQDVKKT